MGMSASQARLIQLTARMSDLELEGQQINQERLNVSNQINTISEQALRVPVPTAPNPQEYMNTGYVGTDGDGKTVGLEPDGNGGFRVSTETPAVMFGKSNEDTKQVGSNEAAKPEAHNSIEATYTPEKKLTGYEYDNARHTEAEKTAEESKRKAAKEKAEADVTKKKGEEPKQSDYQKDVDDYDKAGNKTGSHKENDVTAYNNAHDTWQNELTELQNTATAATNGYNTVVSAPAFDYYELDKGKTATVTSQDGASDAVKNYHPHGINNTAAEGEPIKYKYTDSFGQQKEGDADALANASSGYSSDQITDLCKLYKDDGSQITVDDFDKDSGALKYDGKLYSEPAKEKIGDRQAYTYKEVEEKLGADFIKKLKYTIKADLGADKSLKDSQIEAELENYRFTQEGNQWVAYKITDAGAVKYGETINGVSFDENKTSGRGRFSNSGVLTGVTYTDANGNEVTVKAKKQTELDEVKYGEAMAEYENAKAEYDHIQEEFNQETKKWQQIDKQLELKLKRLDTERNSLNTEIDAVKKVIQDNTDKSFKTFSG